jgi:hypothetical protein
MTDNLPAPTRQAEAIEGRSKQLSVTGRLKVAIDAMVWEGTTRSKAAEKARMTDHSLRAALKKPHVLRYYHVELGVLRESARAKNFHRLDSIADETGNGMARVAAIKTMEAISNDPHGSVVRSGSGARSGYVIDLSDPPPAPGLVIVITPARDRQQTDGKTIDVTPSERDRH